MVLSGNQERGIAVKARHARERLLEHVADGESGYAYVFELKWGERSFGLDIMTLLACIELGEKGQAIPAVPESWWADMLEKISLYSQAAEWNSNWNLDMAQLARYSVVDCVGCWESGEDYVFDFTLSDVHFAIGLRTILACLAFAEREKVVNALPSMWWGAVQAMYGC